MVEIEVLCQLKVLVHLTLGFGHPGWSKIDFSHQSVNRPIIGIAELFFFGLRIFIKFCRFILKVLLKQTTREGGKVESMSIFMSSPHSKSLSHYPRLVSVFPWKVGFFRSMWWKQVSKNRRSGVIPKGILLENSCRWGHLITWISCFPISSTFHSKVSSPPKKKSRIAMATFDWPPTYDKQRLRSSFSPIPYIYLVKL